jgi:16S rRNA (cytosine1407-C5)-methyltransferase
MKRSSIPLGSLISNTRRPAGIFIWNTIKSMEKSLPSTFLERLKEIVPDEQRAAVLEGFREKKPVSLRVNTLKTTKKDVLDVFLRENIPLQECPWTGEALILEDLEAADLERLEIIRRGEVYRQGLSSMLPVAVLDPQPGENVLDMCAAPGSKTTQIAARMNNQGKIAAIEAVRGRYYKLRAVAQLMGATNISFHLMDARRFQARDGLFDRILVDAPCSSEGRFDLNEPKTFAYWSPRKIKEMAHKQRGLLLSACRLLKPDGILVYSTCTFAPEENEGVVDWLLRKTKGAMSVQEICPEGVASYPAVTQWNGKPFDAQVGKCFRVLPGEQMEGFFLAKLKKNQ